MKRTGILFIGIGVVIVALLIVQISVSNMLSTGGIQLSQIQTQISQYQRQNTILKEKILTMSSLTTLSAEAVKKGFVLNTTAFEVVSNTQPLAYKQ